MNERRKWGGGGSVSRSREWVASLSPQTRILGSILLTVLTYFIWRSFDRPGDRFWRFHEIGRGIADIRRGSYSAPDATTLLFLALALGAPVLGLCTLFLRERLRKAKLLETSPALLGCLGLLAGAVLFTVVGPLAFVLNPVLAIPVGVAFLLRAVTLLPARGSLARERFLLLAGVSLYWLVYWAYETAMEEWSRSVSGAIRVDIVILYPMLYMVSAVGIWLAFDRWSKGPDQTVQPGLSGRVGHNASP